MSAFADAVLTWFAVHGRKDLPWQRNPTAYRVWVSEIMLQQTQVTTVIPFYRRFMQSFPDAVTLADAVLDDVLHHWSGLGYYARARNLHKAACVVRDEHAGEFPGDFEAVLALPGIGRSTAGAILSLSAGQRWPILDGNVKRVLARHAGIGGWPGQQAVANELWQLAEDRTPGESVAAYNQAMMDLGATVCVRSSPQCGACPVSGDCVARTGGRIAEFPGRKPKKAKPLKQTRMLLVRRQNECYLERRAPSGIWGGLWSFPELAATEELADWCEKRLAATPVSVDRWETLRHSFSHFDLDIQPLVVRIDGTSSTVANRANDDGNGGAWYPLDNPPPVGLAAPVAKLLKSLQTDGSERLL